MADLTLLLVDDEALARLRLRGLIDSLATATPPLQADVLGEAADVPAALAWLQHSRVDAVLLDIRMPGDSGLQLADRLRRLPVPPAVIFVTAHSEHALRAFELDATDYLTKPVRRERLHAALLRVQQRKALRQPPAPDTAQPAPPQPVLVFSDRGRMLRLPLPEVLYLKAEQKYVTLRTAEHSHVLDETLSELETRLADLGGDYLRVHRNALVARSAIRELALQGEDSEGWAVRVAPLDEWLQVSRRQVAAVRAALAEGGSR